MTTVTTSPPGTDVAESFAALGKFLKASPAVARRLPPRTVSIPLKGSTAEERIAELHAIARELGTAVDWENGIFIVTARFGAVTLEAHHNPAAFWFVQGASRKAAA